MTRASWRRRGPGLSGRNARTASKTALKASRKPIKLPTLAKGHPGRLLPVRAGLFAEPGLALIRRRPACHFFNNDRDIDADRTWPDLDEDLH